jgi:hypothetical protein
MAYLGYCFNLKGQPGAAIPWYERAIQSGAVSVPIYNNLGASYLAAQTQYPPLEKLQLAERRLEQALAIDDASFTVQLNMVRLATARAAADRDYDPFHVWRPALAVLKAASADAKVQSIVAAWYENVLSRQSGSTEALLSSQKTMPADELRARKAFDAIRGQFPSDDPSAARHSTAESRGTAKTESSASISRFYLEPR